MNRKELTGDEALALIAKRREYQREYQRKPEVKAKQREYQRKLKVGYEAAKKAGLIE